MKKVVIILIGIILGGVDAMCQDTTIVYYNKDWKECDKKEHHYYSKQFVNEFGTWQKLDFYKNSTLQMTGAYLTDSMKVRHGMFIYFADNGDTTSLVNYVNGISEGKYVEYFDNGNANVATYFKDGKQDSSTQYYYKNGNLSSSGFFKMGRRVGIWKYYNSNGDYLSYEYFVETYEAPCGYTLEFPDRWIMSSHESYGTVKDGISVDWIFRKGVRSSSGKELVFRGDVICLNRPHFSADDVCQNWLRGLKVKSKKITSYEGITFDFDGPMYFFKEKRDGKKLNVLMFANKNGDSIMQVMFAFEKDVNKEQLKEIAPILESLNWE